MNRKTQYSLREDGASIVEMALASAVVFAMLFGVIYFSMMLYTYHYISEAAREGSRYAIVRGSASCTNSSNHLPNCNATNTVIGTYVQDLGYPGIDAANKMTVNTTWYTPSASLASPTVCTTGTCNAPGNIVKVQVIYAFPLSIPFYGRKTLNLTSSSQMVIAQ
jgi:Flp pilus assembly protein TadG